MTYQVKRLYPAGFLMENILLEIITAVYLLWKKLFSPLKPKRCKTFLFCYFEFLSLSFEIGMLRNLWACDANSAITVKNPGHPPFRVLTQWTLTFLLMDPVHVVSPNDKNSIKGKDFVFTLRGNQSSRLLFFFKFSLTFILKTIRILPIGITKDMVLISYWLAFL